MHLADGIVSDAGVLFAGNAAGALGLWWAVHRARAESIKATAWTGSLGAFALAAQAINLPIGPGVSAHLIGTPLLTLCVGPARAIVAMAAVLTLQAGLLADGGLTVLGINLLHLAILPALATALCMGVRRRQVHRAQAAAIAGALGGSLMAGASLTGVLTLGAGAPAGITLGWLLSVQGAAALVEGVATALVIGHLARIAPALIDQAPNRRRALGDSEPRATAGWTQSPGVRWAALACLVLAALVPLATESPDALAVVLDRLHSPR